MSLRINPTWQAEINSLIVNELPIDVISQYAINTQWLIVQLSKRNIPFKVHNLGAGVKRITTTTDICPCCKQKLSR